MFKLDRQPETSDEICLILLHHNARVEYDFSINDFSIFGHTYPVDTGGKWNVHKAFRRYRGRLLNVLCAFDLRPVSTG